MGYTFHEIIDDPAEGQIVILCIITLPLCTAATILRLVATKQSGRKFGWDDLFAILALIGFLVYAIAPFVGVGSAGDMNDDELAILTAKLAYIASPFYYINQLFARGSLFIMYYRIFWSDATFVKWIYALAAIHVSWFITFFFFLLFLCIPVSKWWDINGTQPGYCVNGNAFLVPEEAINSALDFAMIVLTVAVVQKLQTKTKIKTKLAFIFMIGGLSGVIGFVKIGIVYYVADTNGQENNTQAFWDILQMATSIFCACAPMYKTIVPVHQVWVRLKTSVTAWTSKTRLYRSLHDSTGRKNSSGKTGSPPKNNMNGGIDGSGRNDSRLSETRTNWPQFVGGSQTQYTRSEVETIDIQLLERNPGGMKHGQVETSDDLV